VSFSDWMLAFHLLSAFAVASALVLFSVLVFSGRRMTTLEQTRTLFRVAPLGSILISAGIGLVFVFGVILALDSDRFDLWDGWVIAGIILWAAFAGVGQRSGAYYTKIQKLAEQPDGDNESEVLARLRASTGVWLHVATIALFVLILLDMIYKPGA
jgi:phosphoglycerol transferase MdoB-like AlkP superfamily enzyme